MQAGSPGPSKAAALSFAARIRRNVCWGACWLAQSSVGDMIKVWIVEVRGTRLFFEAATKQRHVVTKEPVPSAKLKKVEQEITKIIGSIRFD